MTRFPAFALRPIACAAALLSALAAGRADAACWGMEDVGAPAAKPAGGRIQGQAPGVPASTVEVLALKLYGRPDREIFLDDEVEIRYGSTTVTADRARYDVINDRVHANGNILMRRSIGGIDDQYTGQELDLKVEAGVGYLLRPTYRLGRNNAQGHADRIDFEAEDRALVREGTYSTCESTQPDWYLKSSVLHLDTGRDVGTAGKTVVYFKGVPILGMPAMSFPLSDARKSGFLPPTIGTTNKGGLELTVPYYFNIAPNRDLTLYPNLIARRGLQVGAEARYLGESFKGETRAELLPSDRLAGTSRWAYSATHSQGIGGGWSFGWNLNGASDDDYPSDFSRTITTAKQRLLGRDLLLNFGGDMVRVAARASDFQVLQDPAAPIVRPYARLPQVLVTAGRQDAGGFDWNADAEITRFWHPDLLRGDRLVLNPQLSFPVLHAGYFITPRLAYDVTRYALHNPAPGAPDEFTRSLPTASLDAGLVFERPTTLFGKEAVQTLEPRLFYVRTPYRDQRALPVFDTAEADLSFAQLFSENRFIGHDRIGDANQLTAAMVSRFIEQDGAERLRLAVGQRYYFEEQRVTLSTARNESRSDLLVSAGGSLTPTFTAEANMQYSVSLRRQNRSNFAMHWAPQPKHILNLQYRRDLLNNLEQVDTSAQWPLADRWYGVARVNYSLPDRKVVEGLFGAEYKADCWVFRMVGQRIPTATGKATSALFFQLELNGLTRLGSNPLDALRSSIPGYQLINRR